MKTTEPNRNFRIPRKLLPLIGILAALFAMLALCGWSFGNTKADASGAEYRDCNGRPIYFYAESIPERFKPSTLIARYQSGYWGGSELNANGVTVFISERAVPVYGASIRAQGVVEYDNYLCEYGVLCYELDCQRTDGEGRRYNKNWTVIVPVYPDIPVDQQATLIAEADAAFDEGIVKLVATFADSLAKNPYKERYTWRSTGALMAFNEDGLKLYRRGRLLDTLPVKNAESVGTYSDIVYNTWRGYFSICADGRHYHVYDNGQKLVTSVTENVVFYGSHYATFEKGSLELYSGIGNRRMEFIQEVTEAGTVYIPTQDAADVVRCLVYVKNQQTFVTDSVSKLANCIGGDSRFKFDGDKLPYKNIAELRKAIDAGEVTICNGPRSYETHIVSAKK